MTFADRTTHFSRRRLLLVAGGLAAATLLPRPSRAAESEALDRLAALTGGRAAEDAGGLITLELPQIAENGNTVPIAVEVQSPMTAEQHVKAVHVVATGNPRPEVASFHFTPQSGLARAATRMRLARTQDLIAVAEMSDGRLLMARAQVKVTIGGCGG